MAVTETENERTRAANALRKLQRIGLNRAYRKWVAVTETEGEKARAANALRKLQRISLTRGFNKWVMAKTAFGWVSTCVLVGFLAGILTAWGAYAPSARYPDIIAVNASA